MRGCGMIGVTSLVFLFALGTATLLAEAKEARQPHIVLLLADDFGWSNIG